MIGWKRLLVALTLARIISGEAGPCPAVGQIAVAKVWENRVAAGIQVGIKDGWMGDARPDAMAFTIALLRSSLPDPTDDAVWLIGPDDVLPWLDGRESSLFVQCAGTSLRAFTRNP